MRYIYAAIAVLVIAGCSGSSTQEEANPAASLKRANAAEPSTLDPHRAEGVAASNVLRDIYEGLVAEAPDGSLVPGAAARWEISDDGLVYTFFLREAGRWSNGDPVVAEDFAAGIRRTTDPKTASNYARLFLPLENAQAVISGDKPVEELGIRAAGDKIVEIRLQRPTPYLLGLLTNPPAFPLHRASFATYGDDFVKPGNLISNGAYQLKEWRIGDRLITTRNPYFHDAASVSIEQVEFLPIEDTMTELNMFRAGELDFTSGTPNSLYRQLRQTYGDQLVVHPMLSTYFYVFDLGEPPMNDVRVREALTIAVDRDDLVDIVLGTGQPGAWGLIPPGVDNYESFSYDWRSLPREEQLERARNLYKQAGYSEAQPLEIDLLYNTSDNHKKIAVAIQGMLRENLGARVNLINQEWKVLLENRMQREGWDLLRLSWSGDYNDPNTFLEIFSSNHAQNTPGFESEAFDNMLEQIANELDPVVRAGIAADTERFLMERYPILPLYFYASKHLVSERVGDFTPNIGDRIYSRYLTLNPSP